MLDKKVWKMFSLTRLLLVTVVPNPKSIHLKNLNSNKNLIIKNANFLRTNFVIAIDFLSFIIVVKLNGSIIVFKKSLKQVKNEACQVLKSFVSNIVSFLKERRKILKGAILCRKSIEWVTLLIRSNLIMSAKKKSNLWDSQMHQKVLRNLKMCLFSKNEVNPSASWANMKPTPLHTPPPMTHRWKVQNES